MHNVVVAQAELTSMFGCDNAVQGKDLPLVNDSKEQGIISPVKCKLDADATAVNIPR